MDKNKQSDTSCYQYRPIYRTPAFLAFLAIIIAGGVFTILFFSKRADEPAPPSTTNDSEISAKQEEETNGESINDDSIGSQPSVNDKTPVQYDGSDPNLSDSLTGFISTARFDSDKLIIRAAIDQYLSSGTCTLVLSDGNGRIEKTAKLIPDASTSTCEGFDIVKSEIANFSRPINIEIDLAAGDKTGTIKGIVE